jgi:hypothetical protein
MATKETQGMTLHEADEFRNMLDNYFEDRTYRARGGVVENGVTFRTLAACVDSLLAARDTEISRLKAQLESIRAARDEAQAVLTVLNPDPTVAMFQIATHFQTMGNKVGLILQDEQS